ncbi:MAG TPA: 6-carboxytetrahydropterin synthase [Phycisphaerae bacterium]|nr:6-carboxytetrahydropterin synthase [Phycisphaerae bacterium]
MSKYELLIRTEFSAAHQLMMPDGGLEAVHSHNWRVEVFLEGGELNGASLLVDFTVLQRHLSQITGDLQDRLLNDVPAFAGRNPSTEKVAQYLHDRFAPVIPENVRVTKVRVWETLNCAAAYVPDAASADEQFGPDAPGFG